MHAVDAAKKDGDAWQYFIWRSERRKPFAPLFSFSTDFKVGLL
jgi:hypothetical protein